MLIPSCNQLPVLYYLITWQESASESFKNNSSCNLIGLGNVARMEWMTGGYIYVSVINKYAYVKYHCQSIFFY